MYTKVCWNVGYILYTFYIQEFVQMWYTFCIKTFCIQNVYKVLSKCGIQFYAKTFCIHFIYINSVYNHFVYILYTRVCPNVVYILYKNILYTKCIQSFVEMWDTILCKNILYTFHIHQFWCTKSVHHKHYVYNFYTKLYAYIIVYIIVCRMDPLFQHILTRLLCTF